MERLFKLTPSDIPNDGILFADLKSRKRSGHMGHALVEYARDSILAFYPNCSPDINQGHNGFGWVEYKRTTDAGKTWSEPIVLEYSYKSFTDGRFSICCEKAVMTDNGVIVLFCVRNIGKIWWDPYLEPIVLRSFDNGVTWSEPILFSNQRGRIYDTLYKDGIIYALEFCNDAEVMWAGNKPEHLYRLYISADDGLTFQERSIPPFNTDGRAYGALEWLPDGGLIAYVYNMKDEYHMDCCVSSDNGFTWSQPFQSYCSKRIRNPQVCSLNGLYFLHGRSGNYDRSYPIDFILYTSEDGINWDSGECLHVTAPDCRGDMSYYSNNIVTGRFGGAKRVLIQGSVPYFEARENVNQWWIDANNDKN